MSESEITTTFTPPKRSRVLGLRRSAIVEIALALVLLLALDASVFDRTRYWEANPHPFWFVVLFIAGKYGTKEGLIAAIAASVALLWDNVPEQSLAQDYYAYLFSVLKLPILWLVSAVAFGELRQMHIRSQSQLEESLIASQERESRIAQSYQWVRQLKDQFELRVAGQLRSSLAAYQAAKSMETLSPKQVLQGFEELVAATLHPQQFSIYLLGDKGLDVAVMVGWREEDAHYRRHFDGKDALYQAVIAGQQVPCVARAEDERVLGNQGLLAAPVVDRDTGEVVGMIKIEKMQFADLNLSNIEALSTIGAWAGKAITNARRYQTAKAGSVVNPDHNLFTRSYFSRFSDYITSLAKRLNFPVMLVTVKLVDISLLGADERLRVARALAESVDNVLRGIDMAFDYHEQGDEYAIVLPATDRKGADIVLKKIRARLESRLPDISKQASFSYSIQAMYDKRAAA